ncbi:MAG: hypothetical protein ACI4AQ_05145 [Lachnospiraceae bacterium]
MAAFMSIKQVYTKEDIDGGIPVEGILYERYGNGNLCYYCFYHDGMPHGQRVEYYEGQSNKK